MMGKKNELFDCNFFTFLGIVTYAFVITVIIVLFVSYFALVTTVSSESVSQDSYDCKVPLPVVNSEEDTVIGYIYWGEPWWDCEPICKPSLKPQNVKGVVE